MKITDLMDNYYDPCIGLRVPSEPTAARTLELTLKKMGIDKKVRRSVPVGALIAAACAAVCSITAGAVGYSLWDAAREDAGLDAGTRIPEYTEYSPETAPQVGSGLEILGEELVDSANVELVSTLCAGEDVTAYVSVSPVPRDMADASREETQELDVFASWEAYVDPADVGQQEGISYSISQVEYNAETETALLRLGFRGKCFAEAVGFTAGISWFYQAGDDYEEKYYGAVHIPVTPSEVLTVAPDQTFENHFLKHETATVTEIRLGANYVSVSYTFKPLAQFCKEYGENAYFVIGDAYEGYYAEQNGDPRRTEYSALDAEVYYGRSWSASLRVQMETAYFIRKDGSTVSLGGLLEIGAEETDASRTVRFELDGAIDLSQVESITFGGETYFVK